MTTPGTIRRLLEGRGLRPKKSLGQTFLANPRVIDRLMELSGIGAWDHVLEIGTGPGHITREIAERVAQVVGIELDEKLADMAREMVAPFPNVRIICDDGAEFARHLPADHSWLIFSNLPYASVQTLLLRIFSSPPQVASAILMVQSEVFDKLGARPGSRTYGPLGVLAQATGTLSRLMRVSAAGFFPRPRGPSVVFRWDRREPLWSLEEIESAQRALQNIFRRRRRRREREWVKLAPRRLLDQIRNA